MNFLGKILVVFTALASVILMVMAMLVYATHTNWQQNAAKLQQQLTTAKNENQQLTSSYQVKAERLESMKNAALADVAKLETERTALIDQTANIQRELDRLRQQEQSLQGLVAATEKNNNRLQEEVASLRTQTRQDQEARDQAFAQTLQATSALHGAAGELEQVKERNAQLAQQLGMAKSALREGGIDDAGGVTPRVRGIVNGTLRDATGLLVQISLGTDDGIKPNQTVEIFRGDKYLGRAQVLKTDPDRAVARVLRQYQVGTIQEGDNVATKLRAG